MYQPGIDQRLAQILSAERLEEAARERLAREAQLAAPKVAARRWVLALAATAPLVVGIIWAVATH